MRIGIVGNRDARGLEKDRKLITPILLTLGHSVHFIQFDEPHEEKYDLVICLEIVLRNLVRLSKAPPWLIVNCEWLTPESIKTVQRSFGAVLCKTHEAHRICKGFFGDKAHYTGFLSEDRFDSKVTRKKVFLHVAGHSQAKNTTAVIDAWRWKWNREAIKAPLYVVSDFPIEDLPERVYLVSEMKDSDLKDLQNECMFHLQPSATEGWSHVLHEAMSVNANILTVNAAPMNEIHAAYKIPSVGSTLFNSVKMHEVSAIDVHRAVQDMLRLGQNGFAAAGMPRKEFLDGNEAFKKAFTAHLEPRVFAGTDVPRPRLTNPCIAFCGNFADEHSTENQILWALEQGLGYEVEKLQESSVSLKDIYETCEYSRMLLWVRTPNWLKAPDEDTCKLLEWCKNEGIKTVGCHLDKFWGIPERETLVGKIPFWKCEYVFTADGSRQEDFAKRGVNHFYMPPAASEVYSHRGSPRESFRCDVGFVGAKSYHAEHHWRPKLIDFLQETYGERFKLIESGLRGHELNDFYASCKVCIGDCFGSGKIRFYYSDRMVETPMRYGFLLSPKIKGMDIPLATFEPENLNDLQEKIEYWLSHPGERYCKVIECAEHVRKHDTWTHRMQWIMETIAK